MGDEDKRTINTFDMMFNRNDPERIGNGHYRVNVKREGEVDFMTMWAYKKMKGRNDQNKNGFHTSDLNARRGELNFKCMTETHNPIKVHLHRVSELDEYFKNKKIKYIIGGK